MRAGLGSTVVGVLVVTLGCENTPPKIADDIDQTPRDASVAAPRDAGADPAPADAAPLNHDAQDLRACSVEEPCPYAELQLIEAQSHNIPTDRASCVLNALAARTPGRYRYLTESVFTNGGVRSDHTLIVTADGSVVYARETMTSLYSGTENVVEQGAEPSQRCTLKPPSYFEDCATEVGKELGWQEDELAWACAFGDGGSFTPSHLPWFEACEAQSPAQCE
jgi:hypothetical protein